MVFMKKVFWVLFLSVFINSGLIAQDRELGLNKDAPSQIGSSVAELLSGSVGMGHQVEDLREKIEDPNLPDTPENQCKMARHMYDYWYVSLTMEMHMAQVASILTQQRLVNLILAEAAPEVIEAARQSIRTQEDVVGAVQAELERDRPGQQATVNQKCFDVATVDTLDIAYYGQGRFVKTGANRWLEVNYGGGFLFEQIRQDAWSLYLKALDRHEFYIQIDLWRNMIRFRNGNQPWRDLYAIEWVSSTRDFVD